MRNHIKMGVLLLALMVVLVGCGSSSDDSNEEVSNQTETSTVGETEVETEETEAPTLGEVVESEMTGIPVVDSVNRFISIKSPIFTNTSDLISADEKNLMMIMELMGPAMLDLELVSINFIQSPEAAAILGNIDFKYDKSGDDFTISYKGSNSDTLYKSEGTYDEKKDALHYENYQDDQLMSVIEYIRLDDQLYATQYYSVNTAKTYYIMFDAKNFSMAVEKASEPPKSIINNPPDDDFTFGKNDQFYIFNKEGKIEEAIYTPES